MRVLIIILCSLLTNISISQTLFTAKGQVTDVDNLPISDVHLYLHGSTIGTISNDKGQFNLKIPDKFCPGKLTLSHIEYIPTTIQVTCKDRNPIIIKLKERIVQLEEVSVTALSARQIINNAITNLKKNFQVNAVNYIMYSRLTEMIGNEPLLIEEEVYNLYHKEKAKPKFNILKVRGKGFNKLGEKRFNESRLIGIHSTESHIMLRYLPDFLKKNKIKKYTYRLEDEIQIGQDSYYVISIDSDNYLKGGEIHVNKKDFGISYLKQVYQDEDWNDMIRSNSTRESYYKKDDGKWYFIYGSRLDTWYLKKEKTTIKSKRITVATGREAKMSFEKSEEMGRMSKMLKDFKGDFNDNFWENYNYIPLDSLFESAVNR